jgi:hypothetical protein
MKIFNFGLCESEIKIYKIIANLAEKKNHHHCSTKAQNFTFTVRTVFSGFSFNLLFATM